MGFYEEEFEEYVTPADTELGYYSEWFVNTPEEVHELTDRVNERLESAIAALREIGLIE